MLFFSGHANIAGDHLLDFIKVYAPAPIERAPMPVKRRLCRPWRPMAAKHRQAQRDRPRKVDDDEPTGLVSSRPCPTRSPDASRFFKVVSGVVKNEATLENYTRRGQERFST